MSSPEFAQLGYALKIVQNLLKNTIEDRLRPMGLTIAQFSVLYQLHAQPGQTNADLARRAFMTAQSMQGVLSNLENAGLILRRADADHGRRQLAELTPNGAARFAQAEAVVNAVEAQLAQSVAPLAYSDALRLMTRLHAGLVQMDEEQR